METSLLELAGPPPTFGDTSFQAHLLALSLNCIIFVSMGMMCLNVFPGEVPRQFSD